MTRKGEITKNNTTQNRPGFAILSAMKTKLMFAMIALACACPAEQLRLKFAATAEILDDAGKVVGVRKLKAGTVVAVEDSAAPVTPAKKGKLSPSKISPAMFLATQPPSGAVFRATLSLCDIEHDKFPKGKHWSVLIAAQNEDLSEGETLWGYVSKSHPVGKRLIGLIKDGKDHLALIKVRPVKDEFRNDNVTIEDFEPIADEP